MAMDPECPECAAAVPLSPETLVGEIVTCPDCGMELEVTQVNPAVLQAAPEEEEDWGE